MTNVPDHGRKTPSRILLYIPNLLGYARVGLLAAALRAGTPAPLACFNLCLVNILLDGVDGALARTLDQTSAFGAFLDVAIDLATRGALYAWALDGPAALAIPLLESLVFTCTHAGGGAAWKTGCFKGAPRWVRAVMVNNFKTLAGGLTVLGLMGLPLHLFAHRWMPETIWSSPAFGAVCAAGRVIAASVELWVLQRHVRGLLMQDATS